MMNLHASMPRKHWVALNPFFFVFFSFSFSGKAQQEFEEGDTALRSSHSEVIPQACCCMDYVMCTWIMHNQQVVCKIQHHGRCSRCCGSKAHPQKENKQRQQLLQLLHANDCR
jgi:hypothetical protein